MVCGFPRSGTTFLQHLLNTHHDISIAPELRLDVAWSSLLFARQIRRYHAQAHEQWRELGPKQAQEAAMRAAWFYSMPNGLLSRRYGNKTPFNEFFYPFLERIFSENPPLYVYALRRGDRVLESVKRQSWGVSIRERSIVRWYKASVRCMLRMRKKFPERLHVVQLDKAQTPEERRRLVQQLFAFVGEELDAEVESFLERWPLVNESRSTQSVNAAVAMGRLERDGRYRALMAECGY